MASGYDGGSSSVPLQVCASRNAREKSCLSHIVGYNDSPKTMQFMRENLSGSLFLPRGQNFVSLRATALPEYGNLNLALLSVELVLASTQLAIAKEKDALAADTGWLRSGVPFGVFFHWNSFTMPLWGEKLGYDDAVANLNVQQLCSHIAKTGARVVVFTTTWAGFYFPAPLESVNRVLPGRTSKRDLVRDLAEELLKKDIRLFLYFHYGKDDREWWSRSGCADPVSRDQCWNVWLDIITEVGTRYGPLLAGWWIDDAMTGYYSRSPPWRKMWTALKSGYVNRLVGLNPWYLPQPTSLQDFYAGEMNVAGVEHLDGLQRGGDGRFDSGPQQGLYATFSSLLQEGDWTYMRDGRVDQQTGLLTGQHEANGQFPPVNVNFPHLVQGVIGARRLGAVPIFNVLISQEGLVADAVVKLLSDVARIAQYDVVGHSFTNIGLAKVSRNNKQIEDVSVTILQEEMGDIVRTTDSIEDYPSRTEIVLNAYSADTAADGPYFWPKRNLLVGWHVPEAYARWPLLLDGFAHDVEVYLILDPDPFSAGVVVVVNFVKEGTLCSKKEHSVLAGDAGSKCNAHPYGPRITSTEVIVTPSTSGDVDEIIVGRYSTVELVKEHLRWLEVRTKRTDGGVGWDQDVKVRAVLVRKAE